MSEINGPNFSVNPMNLHGVQKVNETPVEPQKEVEKERENKNERNINKRRLYS